MKSVCVQPTIVGFLCRCGHVKKADVYAVFSSNEELQELDISLENLTDQNEKCNETSEETDV